MRRGHYTAAKVQAEALVTEAMTRELPNGRAPARNAVWARRRNLYENDGRLVRQAALRGLRRWGKRVAPCPRGQRRGCNSRMRAQSGCRRSGIQRRGPDPVTRKTYMERIIKPLHPKAMVIYCPMPLLRVLTLVQERLFVDPRKAAVSHRIPAGDIAKGCQVQRALPGSSAPLAGGLVSGFEQGAEQLGNRTESRLRQLSAGSYHHLFSADRRIELAFVALERTRGRNRRRTWCCWATMPSGTKRNARPAWPERRTRMAAIRKRHANPWQHYRPATIYVFASTSRSLRRCTGGQELRWVDRECRGTVHGRLLDHRSLFKGVAVMPELLWANSRGFGSGFFWERSNLLEADLSVSSILRHGLCRAVGKLRLSESL